MFESFRMRLSVTALAVAGAVLLTAAGPAAGQSVVSTPTAKTLYKTGPSGRFLMGGTWLFKLDNHQNGPQTETAYAATSGGPAVFESFRMRLSLTALSVVALLGFAGPAAAQSVVSTPTPRTLYKTGP